MNANKFVVGLCGLAIWTSAPAYSQQTTVAPNDDPKSVLVGRLDLERYNATLKGLGQYGDRQQGTDRNRVAVDWIEAQIVMHFFASNAMAFDTNQLGERAPWLLREIVPLINQSPKLKAEVDAALDELNKSVDEITCSANQFPGQWNNLAGMRVAPYACDFNTKWLSINATVIISDSKGEVYDTITPAAIEHADKITETNPIWHWSTVKPTEEPVPLLATPSVPLVGMRFQ
jgi:hypothetical protein